LGDSVIIYVNIEGGASLAIRAQSPPPLDRNASLSFAQAHLHFFDTQTGHRLNTP